MGAYSASRRTNDLRFIVLLILTGVLGVAFACNGGYKVRIKKIENCAGPDAVITADDNFTVVLTKDCDVKSRGCVRFKDFQTANAKYTLTKDGVQMMQGSIDLCNQASHRKRTESIAGFLRTLGVPEQCPVEAGQICVEPSQAVNIKRFQQYLPLARGSIAVDVAVQHDSGKSCFKIRFDITK